MTRAAALLRTVAGQFPTVASLFRKPVATGRPGHFHYCTACDGQWRHLGAGWNCTLHWAWACPTCRPHRVEG
jgi:hypothetical protein